jgi:penicillin-binding protein 2
VIPEQTDNLEKALFRLQKLIPLEQREIEKVLREAKRSSSFAPIEVKDNLPWEDVAKIEVNLPDLPGLSIDVGEIRQYPRNDTMAHLVGYVGAVTKADLARARPKDLPVLSLPGFRTGRTGLERFYEDELRGTAGAAEVEVNVVGREVRELHRTPGAQGKELKLTIDAELQSFVQKKLGEQESASAIVMDVHTGAVYAMGSVPSFDPNLFTSSLPADKWEELLSDPRLPLNNKSIGGVYPPGSTFKMVTALAALEEGVIDANYFFLLRQVHAGDEYLPLLEAERAWPRVAR